MSESRADREWREALERQAAGARAEDRDARDDEKAHLVAAAIRLFTPAEWDSIIARERRLAAAEETLRDLAAYQVPVVISRDERDIFIAMEQYGGDDEGTEVLTALFGPSVDAARKVHAIVKQRIDEAERAGVTVEIADDPQSPLPPTTFQPKTQVAPLKRRPPVKTQAMIRHLNLRGPQLGFAATALIRKADPRDRRSDETAALRDARARVIAELCDDFGASLRDVAALFDRHPSSIQSARNRGRQLKKGANSG